VFHTGAISNPEVSVEADLRGGVIQIASESVFAHRKGGLVHLAVEAHAAAFGAGGSHQRSTLATGDSVAAVVPSCT
jgi:hypothetical protein